MTSRVDRRTMLRIAGGAGAWLTVGACRSDRAGDTVAEPTVDDPASTDPASTDEEPATLPAPGALALRLVAAPATATIVHGLTTDVYSFRAEVLQGDDASVVESGSYLGPTLHLHQGQRVQVSFDNQLDDESIVHWHGLSVPQDQDGQPPDAVPPGGRYEYDFVVENAPGTYWYHPHPHGLTGEQVYRGLAGLLIVHGDEPGMPTGDNDIALVLQDRTIDPDGSLRYVATNHDRMAGFVGNTLVTNGVAGLEVDVRPEPYRVRLLNGSNSRTQRLSWSTGDALTAVATDGSLLTEPVTVPGLVMTPAQRTDLWVDFSSHEPGSRIELLAQDLFVESAALMGGGGMGGGGMGDGGGGDAGFAGSDEVVAVFVVADGEPRPGTVPEQLGAPPAFDADDAVNADSPKEFVLSTRRMAHWIDGRQWEGRTASDLETVRSGTVELWEFVNLSPMPHPMHLHGQAFRVIERSWDHDSLAHLWSTIESGVVDGGLRDTVLVWPGQRVRIAIPFDGHKGYFLYHCHVLEHEDAGMMRNFHVQ